MSRYYRRWSYYDDYYDDPASAIAILIVLYGLFEFYTNRAVFWRWTIYIGLAAIIIIVLYFIIKKWRQRKGVEMVAKNANLEVAKKFDGSIKNKTDYTRILGGATPQARALHKALTDRHIKCTLELWDGHKHIDLSIPWARIDIEIDGLQHYTNAQQITSDFKRAYYSAQKGFFTIHIPNTAIDNNLDEVAEAVREAARDAYFERKRWLYRNKKYGQ